MYYKIEKKPAVGIAYRLQCNPYFAPTNKGSAGPLLNYSDTLACKIETKFSNEYLYFNLFEDGIKTYS
ncbi:MAG: hypothetical protein ACOC44_17175 [Promethearchaeia archaeon]